MPMSVQDAMSAFAGTKATPIEDLKEIARSPEGTGKGGNVDPEQLRERNATLG